MNLRFEKRSFAVIFNFKRFYDVLQILTGTKGRFKIKAPGTLFSPWRVWKIDDAEDIHGFGVAT